VAYGRVFHRIELAGAQEDPAQWLRSLIRSKAMAAKRLNQPTLAMARKTLTVYRAAVAWYIHLTSEPEESPREIAKRLPRDGPLRSGRDRSGLTADQLVRFRELAETAPEPQRTILLLLPLTGCRISELCGLEQDAVDKNSRSIAVLGKFNKTRIIELPATAWQLLEGYRGRHARLGAYVFMLDETPKGDLIDPPRMCSPRDVWSAVQEWEEDRQSGLLEGVCLHQARHTAATRMVKGGIPLTRVQAILGHKNLNTLGRYVHDAESEDRRAALELLE
jgi:integrase